MVDAPSAEHEVAHKGGLTRTLLPHAGEHSWRWRYEMGEGGRIDLRLA